MTMVSYHIKLVLFFLFCFFVTPFSALARSVYLNGVKIDSVTQQKIDNCTVEIDKNGHIWITAKNYRVETSVSQTKTAATQPVASLPTPVLSQRYWLAVSRAQAGKDQYDIDVWLNGKYIKKVSAQDGQNSSLEITKYVQIGENRVNIIAKKNISGQRQSTSTEHYVRIVIGEGQVQGQNVIIEQPIVDYKRNAAETGDFADKFVFMGR